jgi:hypothetical protein
LDWLAPGDAVLKNEDWFWSELRSANDSLIYFVEVTPSVIVAAVRCFQKPQGWDFDVCVFFVASQVLNEKEIIASVVKAFWSEIDLPLKFDVTGSTKQPKK